MSQHLTALGQLTETRQYCVWARDDLTAVIWRDKQDVHIVTDMHHSPISVMNMEMVIMQNTTNMWVTLTQGTG